MAALGSPIGKDYGVFKKLVIHGIGLNDVRELLPINFVEGDIPGNVNPLIRGAIAMISF